MANTRLPHSASRLITLPSFDRFQALVGVGARQALLGALSLGLTIACEGASAEGTSTDGSAGAAGTIATATMTAQGAGGAPTTSEMSPGGIGNQTPTSSPSAMGGGSVPAGANSAAAMTSTAPAPDAMPEMPLAGAGGASESGMGAGKSPQEVAMEPMNSAGASATPPAINRGMAGPPKHYHESGGFATDIEAGLGGRVIKVTNLKSSGPGSLDDALGQSGPRLIVFEVGGVIEGGHSIRNGEVTIAGQTAPPPGITIVRGTLSISADDVVVSHLAVRVGDGTGGAPDGIEVTGNNIVLDHVISSWGVDETLTLKGVDNVTVFKSIIAEALSDSGHGEGEHSKGNLIFRVCDNISIIGSLYAHNRMRNPRISDSRVAMVNSVVYNPAPGKDDSKELWNYFVHVGDNGEQDIIPEVSFVGNVGLQGPDTLSEYLISGHKDEKGAVYMMDNIIVDKEGNDLFVSDPNINPLDEAPIWPEGLETLPAVESLYEVLRTAGPQPGAREAVTTRIITSVAEGTGSIVDSQDDVGGYPDYEETSTSHTVPDGIAERRAWLDQLEDAIAVDTQIDLSPLYGKVGSAETDRLAQ